MNNRGGSYGRYTRYNNTGTFVPAVTTNVQPVQPAYNQQNKPAQQQQPQQQNNWNPSPPEEQPFVMQQTQQPLASDYVQAEKQDNGGEELLTEAMNESGEDGVAGGRKWLKKVGFKLSMRERRRRQNKQLRKLLTPKNALTVLNELTPGTQHECNIIQEQDQFGGNLNKLYVATLTVSGIEYRGTGLSKLLAKNNAAEQVIRDSMIQQMAKLPELANPTDDKMDTSETDNGESGSFPMMQLASYALHKLFSEWQQEGFKIPNLGPAKVPSANVSDKESVSSVGTGTGTPAPKKPRKVPTLPENAAYLHPCMLLSQMRNDAAYTYLSVEGIKPNSQIFTMGVTVDGTTYVGKAQNKKEARRLAAKKACEAIFSIVYPDDGKVSIEDM